jgi:hypothetical protein
LKHDKTLLFPTDFNLSGSFLSRSAEHRQRFEGVYVSRGDEKPDIEGQHRQVF